MFLRDRGDWCDSGRGLGFIEIDLLGNLVGGILLRAVARNVTCLATTVTGLSGGVEWSTIGCGAVARDVTEFAASIALHGLRLTVTSEMIGSSALVAGSRARSTHIAASSTIATSVAATSHWGTTAHLRAYGIRACSLIAEIRKR